MAEVTKPIALDESFNTTESTPRNIADVLAEGLASANTLANLNDVTINTGTLADKQSFTYNALTGTWVNSTLATPNELNDLSDVTINTPLNKQELLYNDALEVFQNKTTRVELTTAEYNNLVEHDWVLPDVDYYITDAPSMQGTSADLSYDGTTKSTYTKIEEIDTELSGKADTSDIPTKTSDLENDSWFVGLWTGVGEFTLTNGQTGNLTLNEDISDAREVLIGFFIDIGTIGRRIRKTLLIPRYDLYYVGMFFDEMATPTERVYFQLDRVDGTHLAISSCSIPSALSNVGIKIYYR